MADATIASIFPLHQPQKPRPKSGAERMRALRARKAAAQANEGAHTTLPVPSPELQTQCRHVEAPATKTEGAHGFAPLALRLAALALGATGLTMNALYARSLGSSDVASWCFLCLGVAADCAALCLPSVAASAWKAGDRVTAVMGWATFLMVFLFAICGSIGFASTSISDVTTLRSSRVTPAVTVAQTALADAMAARDRECHGGVGRFCRQREDAVTERRQALDAALQSVVQTADPQTDAAIRLVAWVSHGAIKPAADDFAMVRLALLSLLPQIGGILLMVARRT
jgi:hypothetical protein